VSLGVALRLYELHPNITLSAWGHTVGHSPMALVLGGTPSTAVPQSRGAVQVPSKAVSLCSAVPLHSVWLSPCFTSVPHAAAGAGSFCLCLFVHSTVAPNH